MVTKFHTKPKPTNQKHNPSYKTIAQKQTLLDFLVSMTSRFGFGYFRGVLVNFGSWGMGVHCFMAHCGGNGGELLEPNFANFPGFSRICGNFAQCWSQNSRIYQVFREFVEISHNVGAKMATARQQKSAIQIDRNEGGLKFSVLSFSSLGAQTKLLLICVCFLPQNWRFGDQIGVDEAEKTAKISNPNRQK